jgi:hypothetical protein
MTEYIVNVSPALRTFLEAEAAERGYKDASAFAQYLFDQEIKRREEKEKKQSSLAP